MNAQDVLKYGNGTLLGILEGLPYADWETGGVCGYWSVKNVVAHLASYELVLNDVLAGFVDTTDQAMLRAFQSENFNDTQVEQRAGKTPAETLAEYTAAHERTMQLVAQIAPETLREPGTLPWYGLEYALDDFIVYAFYGHKREHSAQIAVFRDSIKR